MRERVQKPSDILETSDAARELEVAKETILQLHRTGKLPATLTVRGRRLFKRSDVERLKREREERRQGR